MCHKYLRKLGVSTRYFFDLSNIFKAHGHEVIFFSMQDPRNIETQYSTYFVKNIDYNVNKSLLSYLKEGAHAIYSFESKKKAEAVVKATKPDGVFLHDIYHHLSPSILHVFKKYHLPVVLHLSDFYLICPSYRLLSNGKICERCKGGKFYNAIFEKCFRDSLGRSAAAALVTYIHRLFKIYENNVDYFIAPSKFVKNKYVEMGFNGERIVHIPQAISLDGIKPNYKVSDYILYFGVIEKWKGIGTLIKAMKNIKDVKLIIAGDGREKLKLEKLAQEMNLKNVVFVGYKVGNDLWDIVSNASFVVVPSEWYEVYGMVTYESFAHGKPVIGSNIGGTAELIEDGKTGLLFEPGNIRMLSEKIRYLINNPELIIKMGKRAREKVETELSPLRNYQSILSLLIR